MRMVGLCTICAATLLAVPIARAAEVTLKDAITCSDFKRNGDGSWYADSVSLTYGPNNSTQSNFFGQTITRKTTPEVFDALNEKCGSGK